MFEKIKYSKTNDETTGEINIPFLSYWGNHLNKLYENIEFEINFNSSDLPSNKAKNEKYYSFVIEGKGPTTNHKKLLESFLEKSEYYSELIKQKTKEYYFDQYVNQWGIAGDQPTESLLNNYFMVNDIFMQAARLG
jgi:hypothetical protein